ncbi:hypothetical protein LTR56_006033 [Elasticomyces elasticus]|nr:hypothetical protein LTR56_006033 [Elasticomyces elasticus]KAK3669005.1 hypothetical protein LTR22_000084 [Elasticomyces elasticus]KAK5760950.1 hypothetical protein LTS12_008954 [Elasticomyces elasticus]
MPGHLDTSKSTAGQKELANWKGTPRGPLILQIMQRCPHIFRRNDLSRRRHALYMLNLVGGKFCKLEELDAALDGEFDDRLDKLFARMADITIPEEPKGSKRSAMAAKYSRRMKTEDLLRNLPCPSPSCRAGGGEDAPVTFGDSDDEDDDDEDSDKIHHAGIFWSKEVRGNITNRNDLMITAGHDCHLQLAITACREYQGTIEEIWSKSTPKIVPPGGYELLNMAVRVTARIQSTIVLPEDVVANQAARDMLRAALRGMWNERVVSNVEDAKNYFLWTDDVPATICEKTNGSAYPLGQPSTMPPTEEKSNGSPPPTSQLTFTPPFDGKSNGSTVPPPGTPPAMTTTPQPAPRNSYADAVKAAYIPPHLRPNAAIVSPT